MADLSSCCAPGKSPDWNFIIARQLYTSAFAESRDKHLLQSDHAPGKSPIFNFIIARLAYKTLIFGLFAIPLFRSGRASPGLFNFIYE